MGSGRKSNGYRPVRGVDGPKKKGKKQMSSTRRADEKRIEDAAKRLVEDLRNEPSAIAYRKNKQAAEEYVMPFGKHKGEKLKDIPKKYLYGLKKADYLKSPLKEHLNFINTYLPYVSCEDIYDEDYGIARAFDEDPSF